MSLFPSKDNGCSRRQFFPPPLSPFPPVQNSISGLVARDLAALGDRTAARRYQTLLASGDPVLPEPRRAITGYLAAVRQNAASSKPTVSQP
jgi:hypothetical protein